MPSTVSIDGFKLEPAPFCTINKAYNRLGNDSTLSPVFTISLSFTIVSDRGSPRSKIDGSLSATGWSGPQQYFWVNSGYAPRETLTEDQKLGSIIRKQEALRQLFASNAGQGHHLEVQSADGTTPLKAQVTLQDMTFQEDKWVYLCRCNITLKANRVTVYGIAQDDDLLDGNSLIESFNEDWQIDTDETPESDILPRTYRITHSLQAKGINKFDNDASPPTITSPAWVQARNAVFNKLYVGGNDQFNSALEYSQINFNNNIIPFSGVADLPTYYNLTNHVRTENIQKAEGSYQVTETWLLASGWALEDYTVQVVDNIDNPLKTVSVNGTITGLEQRNPANLDLITSKYTNANSKFTSVSGSLHARAQTYAGFSLNPLPASQTIGKNPGVGTISYSYDFDNRPTTYISGARSEQITVSYSHQGDVIAQIAVLGRTAGVLLQDLSTKTAKRKTLSISAVLYPQQSLIPIFPDITAIVSAVTPVGTQVYSEPPEENLNLHGQYNYSRTWIYE